MRKYRDVPMDYADATLVALAEELDTRKVFTLDLRVNPLSVRVIAPLRRPYQ
jgi:predicted nucleic acid-binding protein